jgi:hypothetical protein
MPGQEALCWISAKYKDSQAKNLEQDADYMIKSAVFILKKKPKSNPKSTSSKQVMSGANVLLQHLVSM